MKCVIVLLCYYFLIFILYQLFLTEMTINPPEGIVAGPVNEENFFEWEALIV